MLPSKIEFDAAIAAVRSYVDFLRALETALATGVRISASSDGERALVELAQRGTSTTLRRFAHTLLVVEIYGAVEQLVEGLLRDYLARMQVVHPSPADVPEKILRNHTKKSAELLLAADRLPYNVVPRDVIANLHSCQQAAGAYRFNTDAFTLRTANMRTSVVRQLFADIGVENVTLRARKCPSFQRYLGRQKRARHAEFPELEELVELRNEAAHGRPASILSLDVLESYVAFAEAFGNALTSAVDGASVDAMLACAAELGSLKGVFRRRIVCLQLNTALAVGDHIAARTPSGQSRYGSALRIEIDHTPVQQAAAGDVVGIEVGFAAKQNQQFFRLPW